MVKLCCARTSEPPAAASAASAAAAASSTCAKASYSRNAFMNFLSEYRRSICLKHQKRRHNQRHRSPAWLIAAEAGETWSRMPPNVKKCYLEAARNAGYVYKARDRRMNRVMRHLRKALTDETAENRVNLVQLSAAVKQMQLWKRKVLQEILCT